MRTPDGQLTPNTVSPEPGHAGKSAAAKEATGARPDDENRPMTVDDIPGTDGSAEGPVEPALHAALDRLSAVIPPAALVVIEGKTLEATQEGRRAVRRLWRGEVIVGAVSMRTADLTAAAVADRLLEGWAKAVAYGFDGDGKPTPATFEKLREANAKGEATLYTTGGATPND